jgi:HYR domain
MNVTPVDVERRLLVNSELLKLSILVAIALSLVLIQSVKAKVAARTMNRRGRGTIRAVGLILGALAMMLPVWSARAGKSGLRNTYLETSRNSPTRLAANAEPRRFATFSPLSVAQLIADINTANVNGADDIIDLGGQTFTLTAVDNIDSGPNGLPSILSDTGHHLLIENGVIERSNAGSPPSFRLFHISNGGNLTLLNVTIANGNSGGGNAGGGIHNQGTLTLNNCTVSGNSADIGGGIQNLADASANTATITINNSAISGNSTSGGGGGINNTVLDPSGTATLTINNSTISGNSTGNDGGGIRNATASVATAALTINNSTISGNSTGNDGGGIRNATATVGTATLTINNCTMSGNSAVSDGGGIHNSGGTATVGGSIIARNTGSPGPDVAGAFTSNGFNLIGDASNSAGFTQPTDQIGTAISPLDPKLGPLQNNGRPTSTMALLADSPAIDKGDDSVLGAPLSLTTDQRGSGFPRKSGTHVDIGAFELQCTITCPANVTQGNDLGQCGAVVSYPAPTSGGCGTVGCSPQSGSFYPKGTTTVTCSPKQDSPVSCSFTITVNDTQAPSITCPNNIVMNAVSGQCGTVVSYTTPTATDNCDPNPAVTCAPASGSTFPAGTTTVTCTAMDTSGNKAPCSFTVAVTDNTPPAITCLANITAKTATINNPCVAVSFAPAASDNCPGVTTVCIPPSTSCFPVGTTTVTCTATDASNNTATCSFTVSVFNVCLQDDSNPGTVFLGNTITGAYRFCCGGTTFSGVALVTRRGNVVSFQHNAPDRRVQATDDESVFKGSAALQSPPGTIKCTITDRDTRNNSCVCQ